MNTFVGILAIVAGLGFYFLPSMIGMNKRNSTSIFMLNLFLGWSLIGWVVALIWATSKDTQEQKTVINNSTSLSEEIERLHQLKEKGLLTESEFQAKKTKMLQ